MKTIVLLCLSITMSCLANLGYASESLLDEEVVQFLSENGHHFVDIFYDPFAMKRHGALKTRSIFYSKISLAKEKGRQQHNFSVYIYDDKITNLKEIFESIARTNVMKALLIFENPQEDMNAFKGLLTKMDLDDMMFYLAVPGGKNSETLSWFQVISLSSGSVIEDIRFHQNSLRIFQDFNLQGLSVTSIDKDP